MAMSEVHTTEAATETLEAPAAQGWRRLARTGAVLTIVMTGVIQGLAGGVIPPLIAFAVLYVIGLVLLARSDKAGGRMLGVLSVVFLAMNAPFLFPTLAHPDTVADFAPTMIFLGASVITLIGSIGLLRGFGASGAPKAVGLATLVVVIAANAASGMISSGVEKAAAQAGDVTVEAKEVGFAPAEVTADAGTVAIHVTNVDPIRHTFTIDELDVALDLPGNAAVRLTFEAQAGEYAFYCEVPGHEDMAGTLVVR